jgi:hypothetical protein
MPEQRFQREFQFIDGQDKGGRKKSRVHVTKEFYRERRWHQIHSTTNEAHRWPKPIPPPKPKFVVSVTKLDNDCGEKDARRTDSKADARPPRKLSHMDSQLALRSLFSPLGAGRVDPFETYPIQTTLDMHHLVDHCTS